MRGQFRQGRRMDWTTKGVRRPVAHVIVHDDHDVGCVLKNFRKGKKMKHTTNQKKGGAKLLENLYNVISGIFSNAFFCCFGRKKHSHLGLLRTLTMSFALGKFGITMVWP